MSRWSKLKSAVKRFIQPGLDFDIYCGVYRMKTLFGSTDLPRYWIKLGSEIIWDYPRQFVGQGCLSPDAKYPWPYETDISRISMLIRDYVDTPREQLLVRDFPDDMWGLVDILRAADRRIGSQRLRELAEKVDNQPARKVIARRMSMRDATRSRNSHSSLGELQSAPRVIGE